VFCPIDQILDSCALGEEPSKCGTPVPAAAALQMLLQPSATAYALRLLSAVCDVKHAGGDAYVRLSDERVCERSKELHLAV
jgi:hypothetical protein